MTSPDSLAGQVRSIGFVCTGCGRCCGQTEEDSGLVMVSCAEIRAIMAATGLPWEEIAEPYPATVDDGKGSVFALGWCLRQEKDACRFFSGGRCRIYTSRPWICRTYPFMLDGDTLVVSACEGRGSPIDERAAQGIASDLLCRRSAEEQEAYGVQAVLLRNRVPAGPGIVVDSEGVKVYHG